MSEVSFENFPDGYRIISEDNTKISGELVKVFLGGKWIDGVLDGQGESKGKIRILADGTFFEVGRKKIAVKFNWKADPNIFRKERKERRERKMSETRNMSLNETSLGEVKCPWSNYECIHVVLYKGEVTQVICSEKGVIDCVGGRKPGLEKGCYILKCCRRVKKGDKEERNG
jgi:hypothetical protein